MIPEFWKKWFVKAEDEPPPSSLPLKALTYLHKLESKRVRHREDNKESKDQPKPRRAL